MQTQFDVVNQDLNALDQVTIILWRADEYYIKLTETPQWAKAAAQWMPCRIMSLTLRSTQTLLCFGIAGSLEVTFDFDHDAHCT